MKKDDLKKTLGQCRNEIDAIDEKLLQLINQRLEVGKRVGQVKKDKGKQVLDRTREKKVIERLLKINTGPSNKALLTYLFNVIITATREIQKPKTISFVGPEASYTHIAALSHFKHSGKFIEEPNLFEVFRQVDKNESHFGVVPVENSIEGAVNNTLDLFTDFDLNICAEHYEPVSHDLLSLSGQAHHVKSIVAHPQAISQCKGWIKRKFPGVKLEEIDSSSKAAFMASENSSIAAIANIQAAHMYELQTIESKIEDYSSNITRFLVIGKELPPKTGNDRTSIMFATSHVPGALFKALRPVDAAGLNMLKLESRPTKDQNWSYYFFLDVEGHMKDLVVENTIEQIKSRTLSLKVLGSYPLFVKEEKS
ncbi:MAG: prephenate dehydratase [Desulfobacteraceae bacterium]|nr:prephenate dehydratase [Desulfobacteraceae bacterium]